VTWIIPPENCLSTCERPLDKELYLVDDSERNFEIYLFEENYLLDCVDVSIMANR